MTARPGLRVHAAVAETGRASVTTGLPVLDHLLTLLARYAGFDLTLEVEPGSAAEEVAAAGRALGEALREPLRDSGARGYGWATLPKDEALAQVVVEAADRPLLVSNVDLSAAHVGGIGSDVVSDFLRELAEGAGLTLHVRLIEGADPQHVLEAIFKALGVALSGAIHVRARPRSRSRKETT